MIALAKTFIICTTIAVIFLDDFKYRQEEIVDNQ